MRHSFDHAEKASMKGGKMTWQVLLALVCSRLSNAWNADAWQEGSGYIVIMGSQHEDESNPLKHG